MSSVNDSPNHFMILYAISRGMKSVGEIVKVTRLDKAIVENDMTSATPCGDSEKKGFFGGKKERNND